MIALGCLAAPAYAQNPRVAGPFAGLFGGASQATHSLEFRGYLFGAYQEVLVPPAQQDATLLDPLFQTNRGFAGASGSLNYAFSHRGDHTFFNVGGYGTVADYSLRPEKPLFNVGANVGSGFMAPISSKVRVTGSANVSYTPYVGYAPYSAGPDTVFLEPQFGLAASAQSNVPVDAAVEITDKLTKRSTLSAGIDWHKWNFLNDPSRDVQTWVGRATFNYRIIRTLAVYGGYQRGETSYADFDGSAGRTEGVIAGFDYGDSLVVPLGRRTTASFFGAITGVRSTADNSSRYALTGNANLEHQIGRTWNLSAIYSRSFGFVAVFRDAVLTDAVTGSLSGLIARTVSWNSNVGWSFSHVGFDANRTARAATATSTLTMAVSRKMAVYAQYLYYRYQLPEGDLNRFELPSQSSRQIASAGLTVWVPIFSNARSRRDTR